MKKIYTYLLLAFTIICLSSCKFDKESTTSSDNKPKTSSTVKKKSSSKKKASPSSEKSQSSESSQVHSPEQSDSNLVVNDSPSPVQPETATPNTVQNPQASQSNNYSINSEQEALDKLNSTRTNATSVHTSGGFDGTNYRFSFLSQGELYWATVNAMTGEISIEPDHPIHTHQEALDRINSLRDNQITMDTFDRFDGFFYQFIFEENGKTCRATVSAETGQVWYDEP